jgi:hypothetical protein
MMMSVDRAVPMAGGEETVTADISITWILQ